MSTKRTNKLDSPEAQNIFKNNDVILLTESWTNDFSQLNVNNYEYFVLNRTENKKSSKRASGGIIVYIRNEYVSNETLVFKSNDDIICIKIEGCKLSLLNDLFICLCYVVPDESSRQTMIDSNVCDRIIDFITSLDAKHENNLNLLLCGDMNSRTSDCPD